MKNVKVGFACVIALVMQSACWAQGWVGTWGAAPVPPGPAMDLMPATPSFSNQTVRQIVHVSAGGNRLRIRFTNEYGSKPLRIEAARIAITDAAGTVEGNTLRQVLFAGSPTVLIPAGAPFVSDPIDLPTHARSNLSISIYLPEDTGPCTCHPVGMQTAFVSGPGDFTSTDFTPQQSIQSRAFVSGIDVESALAAKTVVAFGDSITDGVGSTANSNRRWPDLLADRLAAHDSHHAWGVVNMGISGNRVLNDGAGQSALARFDRDVLAVPGAAYVILFEGVNDLGLSFGDFSGPLAEVFKTMVPVDKATSERIIGGYRQLIERAHSKGIKVLGATIAPYKGSLYYSLAGEKERQAINAWIRSGGAFDGVLDFDAVLRDPTQPTQIASALHSGDHLHGSDAGYDAVAKSINLSLFK